MLKHLTAAIFGLAMTAPTPGLGDHQDVALFASPGLTEAGLMKFLLPRFSLKTGVRVHVEPLVAGAAIPANAMILHDNPGTLVLAGLGREFSIVPPGPDNPAAERFYQWLLSEIGQRTIGQFAPDGTQLFTGMAGREPAVQAVALSGDRQRGETLSYDNCARCHVIGPKNRMKGIGSTPSFALLRTLGDWQDRFLAFYTLNPHPSFTQITGVTEPFDPSRPSPIIPLVLTQQAVDDIVAFVERIEPVDLGAPLVHQ